MDGKEEKEGNNLDVQQKDANTEEGDEEVEEVEDEQRGLTGADSDTEKNEEEEDNI